MNWVFLDVEAVKTLHSTKILEFGGSAGLRDEGLLISAMSRAEFRVKFDSEATVPAVAASLGFGLIKNHAFIDGNKRIGLAVINVFLLLNGFVLTCLERERIDVIQRVAASEMTEAELSEWIARNVGPAEKRWARTRTD